MDVKVRIFAPADEGNRAVTRALAEGIPGAHVHSADDGYRPCDVAVIFGLVKWAWHRTPYPLSGIAGHGVTTSVDGLRRALDAPEPINKLSRGKADIVRRHKGPVLVVERGFVRRDEYWSLGWNGINGRADHGNETMPGDRWRALGVELKPWRDGGDYVLVCGQVPWDVSVQDTDHVAWCRATVAELHQRGYEVRFRPHPMVASRVDYGATPSRNEALADDLAGAAFVVTWNSNCAVEAVIEGVPAVAMDRGSMAWAVAGHDLRQRPPTPDRTQWAADLAYAQWRLDEFRSGAAWAHVSRGIKTMA